MHFVKGKHSVFRGPAEPPKHPTPCTGWEGDPHLPGSAKGFGPGLHPQTKNTPGWFGLRRIKVCVLEEGWDGGGAAAQSPLVQGDSRFSVDIGSGKKWEGWLKAIAGSHMFDHVGNFSRVSRWLLVEELSTGNSKDLHLILVYLLQCIEVRVLGGKASVGSHIGQKNHFA